MFFKKNSNSLFAIIMFKEPQKQLIWCYVFREVALFPLKSTTKNCDIYNVLKSTHSHFDIKLNNLSGIITDTIVGKTKVS